MEKSEFEPDKTLYRIYLVSQRKGILGKLGIYKKRIGHTFDYNQMPDKVRELTRCFVQNLNRAWRYKPYEEERKIFGGKALEDLKKLSVAVLFSEEVRGLFFEGEDVCGLVGVLETNDESMERCEKWRLKGVLTREKI